MTPSPRHLKTAATAVRRRLPDFETPAQIEQRQATFVRRMRRATFQLRMAAQLEACGVGVCGIDACVAGCWYATYSHRVLLLHSAMPLFEASSRPPLLATIAGPRWERPIGQLQTFDVPAAKQALHHRFRRAAIDGLVFGGFDIAVNDDRERTATWSVHMHLVVAGPSAERLRHAFQSFGDSTTSYYKPVVVKTATNIPGALSYAIKRAAGRRVAYLGSNGRQQRRRIRLITAEQLELDQWLIGLPAGALVFLRGLRRTSCGVRVTENSANRTRQ